MATPSRGYFPGSKQPLPDLEEDKTTKKTPQKEAVTWDARYYTKLVGGRPTEMFTIGALAQALGRSVITLRAWIRGGHIPPASYRLPKRGSIAGRRLYTRPQIEAVVAVAKEHGILDTPRVEWSKHLTFRADVQRAWDAIRAKANEN